MVYLNNGKKVYYPCKLNYIIMNLYLNILLNHIIFHFYVDEPKPYIDGIRINSPHYLCKIKLDSDERKS